MFTFTPLSGGVGEGSTTPLAYVLQVDDVRILLDCGSPDWCPEIQPSSSNSPPEPDPLEQWHAYADALKEYAPTIDLVLLSHGDLVHSGFYPYAYARWGLRSPTYTTLPVQAMARTAVLEEIDSIRNEEQVPEEAGEGEENTSNDSEQPNEPSRRQRPSKFVATSKEVHEAFDSVSTLRYSQPTHLAGKCQGLTITAFNAGHTLGGAIWKIRSPSSGTIVYAVDLNHLRERHLDGTVLVQGRGGAGTFETLARPDVFITDADRVLNISSRRKDRDAQLIDTITSTLSSRHSILMPCDSSARLLELLVLLDQHWNFSRLKYPICLVSKTGREMLTYVRAMMEWMGGTISKEDIGDEGRNDNKGRKRKRDGDDEDENLGPLALRFKHLEFFTSPQTLLHSYSSKDPKLILAVPVSLSHGASRTIFTEFAAVPNNVILLTGRSEEGTLGRLLFDLWNTQQKEDDKWDRGKLGRNVMLDSAMRLTMKQKIPLQGAELETYLQNEKIAKEKEEAQKAALVRSQQMLEADADESESGSDDESDEEDAVEDVIDKMDTDGADGEASPTETRAVRKRKTKDGLDGGDWGFDTDDATKQLLSFDIYLKGHVSKTTAFFKSAGTQTQRYRMFPYIERRRRIDAYGETLDVGMWLRKGKVLEEEAESDELKEAKRQKQMEEEALNLELEPPSKYITTDIEVQLACRLLFVDLEGLNDGRAVKNIVPHVNPRKMIIVHASSEAAKGLTEACAGIHAMTKDIYSPSNGASIQIGQHTNSFSISLSEDLLLGAKMSKFEDNEVGFVVGRIASLASSTIPVLEPASALPDEEEQPRTIKPKVLGSRPQTLLPQSTMIGDLKLTTLKSRLSAAGIQTEFAGEGVLVYFDKNGAIKGAEGDGKIVPLVAIRKTAEGRVELEGTVSEMYYTIRKQIYDLHALVAV